MSRQPLVCDACGAAWLATGPTTCPLCHAGRLAPATLDPAAEPEVVVRFGIDPAEAAQRLEAHIAQASLPMAAARVPAERLVAHHIPAWLVDARLEASFELEVGFDYEVQSTVEQCTNGTWSTVPVTETRIRWEPRAGTLERSFDNEAAPALSTWDAWLEVLSLPEPIVGGSLKDDHPILVPDRTPDLAWSRAARGFRKRAGSVVAQASDAQHARELYLRETWHDVNWTWVLFPVYSASYIDPKGQTRVIRIDGRTGKVTGPVASDPRKGWQLAAFLAIAGLAVLGLSAASVLPAIVFPVLLLLTFVGGALGFVLLCVAAVPPLRVYRANAALPDRDPCLTSDSG